MEHALISTVIASLVTAFIFGMIAKRMQLPTIFGYLLAGVAIGLAQIGKFSFILGGLALSHGLLTQDLYNLILAGAMLSIVLNPFLFRLYDSILKDG